VDEGGEAAALDWTAAQLAGKDRRLAKDARGKLYDLVVFGAGRQRGFVFEAKRWAYSPAAMKEALRRDARKLRDDLPDGMTMLARAQKYVLLLYQQSLKADRREQLDEFCEFAGLAVAGTATFGASLWPTKTHEEKGLFALTALQVVG
jgi:hypothetical protein